MISIFFLNFIKINYFFFIFHYWIQFSIQEKRLTIEQKKELLDKGPFNLIFHGVVPDWIEAEMDDDPDFMKDVLGQRMKNMIKDEVFLNVDNRYTTLSNNFTLI